MKIFVAGASGAIGRRLLPLLKTAGHEVIGTTRVSEKAQQLKALGAEPVIIDMFDREGLAAVLRETRPDVVIHQLTDLSGRNFQGNSRLRREGTRNLVDAARAAGVRQMIAQSIAWVCVPGDGPADERVPLDIEAPDASRKRTVTAVKELEDAVAEMEHGTVLRYGLLYGPGTWYAPDGLLADQVRQGRMTANPGVDSFVHVDDAARAALLALDWPEGVINIVDDEPAPGTVWLPIYAELLKAPAPPTSSDYAPWARGSSNKKARQQLGWQPLYPSWREGLALTLAEQ